MCILIKRSMKEEAERIINSDLAKGFVDSYRDKMEILTVLHQYYNTESYNTNYARKLDERMRDKYSEIAVLEAYDPDCSEPNYLGYDETIRRLEADLNGIWATVLLREGKIERLAQIAE